MCTAAVWPSWGSDWLGNDLSQMHNGKRKSGQRWERVTQAKRDRCNLCEKMFSSLNCVGLDLSAPTCELVCQLDSRAGWNMRRISPCQIQGGEGQGWGSTPHQGSLSQKWVFSPPSVASLPLIHTVYTFLVTVGLLCSRVCMRWVCLALTPKTSIIIWLLKLPMGVHGAYNRIDLPEIQYVNPLRANATHS